MQKTPKLGLNKPDLNDYVSIADLNENMDVLDEAVSELQEGTAIIPDLETTNKTLAGGINENKQNLAAHLADDANPHNTTSEQLVAIDRTNYSFYSPPSAYPGAYSSFIENRTVQMAEWRQALNLPNLSAQRFIIETFTRGKAGDVFQSHKQIITYLRSPAGEEPTHIATILRIGGQGDVWGPPVKIIDEKGGAFKGIVTAHPNTSYTVAQMRSIMLSPTEPTADMLGDGEICLVYEE